jgi:hypothetical protein
LRIFKSIILLAISGILFSSSPADLLHKRKHHSNASDFTFTGNVDARQLRSFENRLTPFFEIKAKKNRSPSDYKKVYTPSQGDLFLIARHWSRLSNSFKMLYTRAAQIPDFMKYYISPGGHFEIYYATSGMDSTNKIDTVNSADSYGFGPLNWRERSNSPNGVPDYIDEVAWAFDSTWSMEIDGFGFVKPLPYVPPGHTSDRFKVITIDMDYHETLDGYYGITNPIPDPAGIPVGLRSYIELRNQWVGWDDPDYGLYPERGVRVTAAHEFFHAIQYAMVRQESGSDSTYKLDDFPLCWLEGSAALMENIAFDYIDDYVQYSEFFFDDPTTTILNSRDPYTYTTVLLAMFLYERLEAQPSISFIKKLFFNNYNKYIDFFANLDSTSKSFSRIWPDILGDFFTQSYYTGKRTRPDYFINDAQLFKEWTFPADSLDPGYSINKEVSIHGMRVFSLTKNKTPFNDGFLSVIGDSALPAAPFWSVHGILQSGGENKDSVFSWPVSSSGTGTTGMTNWSRFGGALVVVSNAQEDKAHHASLVFEPCPITIAAMDSAMIVGAPVKPLSSSSSVSVNVKARSDLACSLSIGSASPSKLQTAKATQEGLFPIGVFYSIGFPLSWPTKAGIRLTIIENSDACISLENQYGVSSAAFAIFQWDENSDEWTKSGTVAASATTYQWNANLNKPGMYGVFGKAPQLDSLNRPVIAAYPNPVRKGSAILFRSEGKVLMQLLVYSMNGALLYRRDAINPVDTLSWDLTNTSGKSIVPGMYHALVGYKDTVTKGMKRKKQKVLIIP